MLLRHAVRPAGLHGTADLRSAGADLRRRRPAPAACSPSGRQAGPDPAGAAASQRAGAAARLRRRPAQPLRPAQRAARRSSAPTTATRVSYSAANGTFIVLRRQLGWTAAGRTRAPRVHDLRHRMVVRRIQAWHAPGVDVDAKIARWRLTSATWRCATSTGTCPPCPELMSIIAGRFETFAARRPGRCVMRAPADRVRAARAGLLPAPPDRPARCQRPYRRELP